MIVNFSIEFHSHHPMMEGDKEYSIDGPHFIRGNYNGNFEDVIKKMIPKIELISMGNHDIEVSVLGSEINIDIVKYSLEVKDEFLDAINNIPLLTKGIQKESDAYPFLKDVGLIVFSEDFLSFDEVKVDDIVASFDNLDIKKSASYRYHETQTGAGHAYDSFLILIETIAVGLVINQLSSFYQKYQNKRNRKLPPLNYLDLTKSVHRMLIDDYSVSPLTAKVTLAEVENDSFDLHLKVVDKGVEFYFIIDKENRVKKFERSKL